MIFARRKALALDDYLIAAIRVEIAKIMKLRLKAGAGIAAAPAMSYSPVTENNQNIIQIQYPFLYVSP